LGSRFLRLIHIGRKSGLERQTVLEVVHHLQETNTYYIASGFGKKSDWYRNLNKTPLVKVQVGQRTWPAIAELLSPEKAEDIIMEYARRHPAALKQLAHLMGYHIEANEKDYRALGRMVPIFALIPNEQLNQNA
jgi:deazaflavin-dependent oxidoreductase (nitroreductase family)